MPIVKLPKGAATKEGWECPACGCIMPNTIHDKTTHICNPYSKLKKIIELYEKEKR